MIFEVGQKVVHRKLGPGVVQEVRPGPVLTIHYTALFSVDATAPLVGIYDRAWLEANPDGLRPANGVRKAPAP